MGADRLNNGGVDRTYVRYAGRFTVAAFNHSATPPFHTFFSQLRFEKLAVLRDKKAGTNCQQRSMK